MTLWQDNWPPPYTVKRHRMAKGVKLKTSLNGLHIVVPPRFRLEQVPSLLEENKHWIIKHLPPISHKENNLPNKISLQALNTEWTVHYQACQAKLEMLIKPHHEIVLIGSIRDHNACKNKLIAWIKNIAAEHFALQLQALSTETNLSYKKFTVRDQKTLWGSCTSQKAIHLNYKLIFLPHELLRYVIIHELCHTKYLNHSSAFWKLVSLFDPNWSQHKNALRRIQLPEWL